MAAVEEFEPLFRTLRDFGMFAQHGVELAFKPRIRGQHLPSDFLVDVGLHILFHLKGRVEEAPPQERFR